MTAETDIAAIADSGDNTPGDVRTALTSVLARADVGRHIASTAYDPGSLATYTTTSATPAAMDTTNLRVTFDAPASGVVIVRYSAACRVTNADTFLLWAVFLDGSVATGSEQIVLGGGTANQQIRPHYAFRLAGLTPTTEYDVDWAHARLTGSANAQTFVGQDQGPALMEVWGAA